MALDAGFMAELMKISYFKDLVEQNGEEWLESIFESLETESYDFSAFEPVVPDSVSLSIDEALEFDLAELLIDTGDVVTTETVESGIVAKEANETQHATRAASAMLEAAPVERAAADATDTSGDDKSPKFDNAERDTATTVDIPHNSEMMKRYLYAWVAMFFPDESYSAHKAEEAVVVGLNGLYTDLKLSAFDDKIYTDGGKGDINVLAGDGSDTLYMTTGGMKADLGGVSRFGNNGGDVRLRSVENVVGSDGDDTIFGDNLANKLVGRGGNDKIDGGGGDDTITGGSGENNLSGGKGNDTITGGSTHDVIDGGSGNDTIDAGGGDDRIFGGDGDDIIDAGGGADRIDGGAGNDTIEGGKGDDTIFGGSGDDILRADAGNDTVDGGAGNDTINGAEGDDEIDGGDGDDTLYGDAGNDKVDGGKGKDTIRGGEGNDTLNGGDGADKLYGDAGNDTIDGGADNDEIYGGDGDDTLLGGAGKDKIEGGAGVDKITGGAGADTLTGGAGKDTYVYLVKEDSGTAADTFDIITDFAVADDKFDLTALLAADTFDFLAAEGAAFTGTGAEVRWDKDGTKTIIEIDIDGNGTADMKIELDDAVDLTASNFSL